MTTYSLAILLLSILFCTVTTVLAVMLRRSNLRKDKMLAEMQAAVTTLQGGLKGGEKQTRTDQSTNPLYDRFDDNLRAAEITTRLQRPRLTAQQGSSASAAPERYRYLQTMVEKGLSAQEIASTLSMSLPEITQLITLIRVANPQHEINEPPLSSSPELTQGEFIPTPATPKNQPDSSRNDDTTQVTTPRISGAVNKSRKLARWLKRFNSQNLSPCFHNKQSGREPPRQPLPQDIGISCHPLPGYT
jgi:hypothetical protein